MGNLATSPTVLYVYSIFNLVQLIHIPPQDVSMFKGLCPEGSMFATDGEHYTCMWCAPYCKNQPSPDCFKFCPEFMAGQGYTMNGNLPADTPAAIATTTKILDYTLTPQIGQLQISDNSNLPVPMSTLILLVVIALVFVCGLVIFIVHWLKSRQPRNTENDSVSVANISADNSTSGPLLTPEPAAKTGTPAPDSIVITADGNPLDRLNPTAPALPSNCSLKRLQATPGHAGPSGVNSVHGIQTVDSLQTGDLHLTIHDERPREITGANPPVENADPGTAVSVITNSAVSQFQPRSQQS